ncbi:MAG TPA: beta-ketoacyl synthase N-terminal-like domain-containing protein, partial [Thermoanaerobaculia bacterium]
MSEPVLITGLGTLGAWGGGSDHLAAALAEGASLAREVDRAAGYHLPHGSRRACLVPPGELAAWLSPGEARRMSPPSKLAVTAARMALRCAGIPCEAGGEAGTAVVIATAFGPSTNTEALLKQILDEGPEAASPSLFMESVANAPAAQIAIVLKARGASLTVCEREAGPLIALGTGAAEIAAGRAGRVLAGCVDEMTPLLHALLDRFGALACSDGDSEELARPFDRRRNGFLAGEGGTVVVLESADALAARRGRALARVLARGSAFDPTAPPSGWGHGHRALARGLRRTLERAGLKPGDVDLVVSGASGAREGDRLEAEVLRAVWEG